MSFPAPSVEPSSATPSVPAGVPLLDELDRRQDEVLQQLDELDGQILQLMAHWQSQMRADRSAAG